MQKMQKNVSNLELNNDLVFPDISVKQLYKDFLTQNLNSNLKSLTILENKSTKKRKHANKLAYKFLTFFRLRRKKKIFKFIKKKVRPLFKMPLKLFSFLEFDKLLKNVSENFHNIKTNLLINNIGMITFKFSRTNRFFSLMNSKGEVINSYSCGIFKNVKRLKHKRNFFFVKVMISFLVYKIKQCNFNKIIFKVRLVKMISITVLSIISYLLVKHIKLKYFNKKRMLFKKHFKINAITYVYLLRKSVVRNGVKLRKLKRR